MAQIKCTTCTKGYGYRALVVRYFGTDHRRSLRDRATDAGECPLLRCKSGNILVARQPHR
eukprot:scaffold392822_cov45-Prasinocladus_malaysianus.AAC.1